VWGVRKVPRGGAYAGTVIARICRYCQGEGEEPIWGRSAPRESHRSFLLIMSWTLKAKAFPPSPSAPIKQMGISHALLRSGMPRPRAFPPGLSISKDC
jgi:hypothetical protein